MLCEMRSLLWGGLAVLLATVLATALIRNAKCRRHSPDSTAAVAEGLEAARHRLLTKDAATNYSYLIEHSAVKLEPNGVIGRGAEGFVMRGKVLYSYLTAPSAVLILCCTHTLLYSYSTSSMVRESP
jgi:hypothetical protein